MLNLNNNPENTSAFFSAAQEAGYEIKIIRGGQIEWAGETPNPSMLTEIELTALKESAKNKVLSKAQSLAQTIVGGYPTAEREGWPLKLAEAKALVDGGDPVQAPSLVLEAQITGEDVNDLAANVIAVASVTAAIPALIAGLRRRLTVEIQATSTATDLQAVLDGADSLSQSLASLIAVGDMAGVQTLLAGGANA